MRAKVLERWVVLDIVLCWVGGSYGGIVFENGKVLLLDDLLSGRVDPRMRSTTDGVDLNVVKVEFLCSGLSDGTETGEAKRLSLLSVWSEPLIEKFVHAELLFDGIGFWSLSLLGRCHCLFCLFNGTSTLSCTRLFILGRETSLRCFAEKADGTRCPDWLRCRCSLSRWSGTWPFASGKLCILDRIEISLAHLG